MKPRARLAAALLIVIALSACGAPRDDCAQARIFCAGFVTSTARLDDHGLNASAWEGLQQAQQDGVVQAADVIETVDARDYGKNIAYFAAHGYDLIITAGAGQADATRAAAEEYPKTQFLALDQPAPETPLSNLRVVTFPRERGGFLAGALAALVSQNGIVGAICETSGIDSMWQYCEGFRLGAQYEKPGITVMVSYHDNGFSEDLFQDEEWGARAAAELIAQGADVIFGAGGRVGQGALRRAAQEKIWGIGSEQDQYYETREASAYLLTSAVAQAGDLVRTLVSAYASGAEVPSAAAGSMGLAPFHEGEGFLSLSAQAELLGLKTSLENGSVTVNAKRP